jgi:hypothetical protein
LPSLQLEQALRSLFRTGEVGYAPARSWKALDMSFNQSLPDVLPDFLFASSGGLTGHMQSSLIAR